MNTQTLIEDNNFLKLQLEDYQRLFESVEVAMIIIDDAGMYLDYNKAYYNLMGYNDKKKLIKFQPADVSPEFQLDGTSSFVKANEMIRIAFSKGKHSFEWMHQRLDGVEFLSYVTLDVINFQNKKCLRVVINDIEEIRKLKRLVEQKTSELLEQTYVDSLTKINNRKSYGENFTKLLSQYKRYKTPFSMIMYDIDDFKQVNDNYGHAIGDKILIETSKLIKSHIRESDYIFRIGGEEFIILLTETQIKKAKLVAEKIRVTTENDLKSNINKPITISIGVTEVKDSDTEDKIFKRVDDLLYKSKHNGKNTVSSDL